MTDLCGALVKMIGNVYRLPDWRAEQLDASPISSASRSFCTGLIRVAGR